MVLYYILYKKYPIFARFPTPLDCQIDLKLRLEVEYIEAFFKFNFLQNGGRFLIFEIIEIKKTYRFQNIFYFQARFEVRPTFQLCAKTSACQNCIFFLNLGRFKNSKIGWIMHLQTVQKGILVAYEADIIDFEETTVLYDMYAYIAILISRIGNMNILISMPCLMTSAKRNFGF